MSLPKQVPGAYAAVFLIWAAAGGHWFAAVAAAAALELPGLLGRRFVMPTHVYRAAWLLSLFIVWLLAIGGWLETNRAQAIRGIMHWVPFAALPLVFVSALARNPGVPVSALLILLRQRYARRSSSGVRRPVPKLDPFFPFVCLVLLSASYQNVGEWYFPAVCGVFLLVFLAGAAAGRGRMRLLVWVVPLLGVAWLVQGGIGTLYRIVDDALIRGGQRVSGLEMARVVTRIGVVGEIKNSPAIRWRVRFPQAPHSEVLPEGTFNIYRRDTWVNMGQRDFSELVADDPGEVSFIWRMTEGTLALADAGLDGEISGGVGAEIHGRADPDFTVLALPSDTSALTGLPALTVQRNAFGVWRAEAAAPVLRFTTFGGAAAPPPMGFDLDLDEALREGLRGLADELGLAEVEPAEAVARVGRFFDHHFQYSRRLRGASVLEFLEEERRGHCEYFATAGALLLRSVGIPTRYHTGFAVREKDEASGQWVLRGLHAHAWITVWVDGRWVEADFTPAAWLEEDMAVVPFWQPMRDWMDEKWLAFHEWRQEADLADTARAILPAGIALAVLYTLLRIWLAGRGRTAAGGGQSGGPDYERNGSSTAWAEIEPMVERAYGPRPKALPCRLWVSLLPESLPSEVRGAMLALVAEHYLARFGGNGGLGVGGAREADAGDKQLALLRRFLIEDGGVKAAGTATPGTA